MPKTGKSASNTSSNKSDYTSLKTSKSEYAPTPTPPTTPTFSTPSHLFPPISETLEEVSHSIENLVIPPPDEYTESDSSPPPPELPKTPIPLELLKSTQSLDFLKNDIVRPVPPPRPQSMIITNKHVRFSDAANQVTKHYEVGNTVKSDFGTKKML